MVCKVAKADPHALAASLLLASEQMQVLRHLLRHGQVLCVETLDLFDRGSCVLGEIEDVHPSLGQDDPHTDGGVPEWVDGVIRVRDRIVLDPRLGPKPPLARCWKRQNKGWRYRARFLP